MGSQVRIFEIAPQKFALGVRGERAIAVVRRILCRGSGRGQPRYKPAIGRRPWIPVTAPAVQPHAVSIKLKTALLRVANG